jgi:hypothetical protein
MDPQRDEMARSSSFARSLYQDASGSGEAAPEAQGAAGTKGAPRARRRQSGRGSRNSASGDPGDPAMMAAAAAVQYEEGEPTHNLPHVGDTDGAPPPPNSSGRQSSWYTDALLQGGGTEDLTAILGQVQASEDTSQQPTTDDDEVLEQYRIMAHVEANIRVKDNTGFDMAEYEKRRKTQPEPTKGDYYSGSKKPKPKLPEPRLMSGGGGGMVLPEEPPLPPPRANRRFIEQQSPKVPELCPGVVVRGQAHSPDGEHMVRCLGCRAQLRVNMLASLVSCPDCSTVSPASSVRR